MHKFILGLTFSIAALGFSNTAASQGRPVRYAGQLVSIDFNGDIREFLQTIGSISGLEMQAPSISRVVTVHLKDIPWDLALDVVLRNSGLNSELDGKVLRIAAANPILGQNRLLAGTITIEGKVMDFQLQNPRTLIHVNAPDADGAIQSWRIEWESANDLTETGVRPNTLKVGDQVIITGNATRSNTLRLIVIKRPADGFSWGDANVFSSAPSNGVMFVSSSSR